MHTSNEEKSDDSKDCLYKEMEQVFYHFPRYHMKMLLGDLIQNWEDGILSNQKLGRRVYIRIVMIVVLEQ